jgi:hypothetical protein
MSNNPDQWASSWFFGVLIALGMIAWGISALWELIS